ncbi:MAG: hypothetical protein AB1445_04785 [Bacillota bacterium]
MKTEEEVSRMIQRVHEHIIEELQQNTKTDIVFIITAIFLNFLTLAINSGFAQKEYKSGSDLFIISVLFALAVIVNGAVILGLSRGKQTRTKLLQGLIKMYKDKGVDGYYDMSLLANYNIRYNIFIAVVVFIGFASVAIPLAMMV